MSSTVSSPRAATALLAALAAAGQLGCAGGVVAGRTRPVVAASAWRKPLEPIRRVAVLTASTVERLQSDPAEDLEDEDRIGRAMEHALFAAGWEPITRVALRRLVAAMPLAIPLDPSAEPGRIWLEDALGVAGRIDGVVHLQGWSVRWSGAPALRLNGKRVCALVARLQVEVHDAAGRLAWHGRVLARSTDLGELRARARGGRVTVSQPMLACVTDGPCSSCPDEITPDAQELMALFAATTLSRRLAGGELPGTIPGPGDAAQEAKP